MKITNFKKVSENNSKYGKKYPHEITISCDIDGEAHTFYLDLSYQNFELIDICPWGLPDGISESDIKKAMRDNNFDWSKKLTKEE